MKTKNENEMTDRTDYLPLDGEGKGESERDESRKSAFSYVTRNVFVGFSAAALGGLLFGYVIGVNSGVRRFS